MTTLMQLTSATIILITCTCGLKGDHDNPGQYFTYSGWLPEISIIHDWKSTNYMPDISSLSPAVQRLDNFIKGNEVINTLTNEMINQWYDLTQDPGTPELNCNITSNTGSHNLCNIQNVSDFLNGINYIITIAPPFHGQHLIGVPLAAYLTGFDATLAGQTLFRIAEWNQQIQGVLGEWHSFLSSNESNYGFAINGTWRENKDAWNSSIWEKDNEDPLQPWYLSWNSFFTRQYINRTYYRPLARPNDTSVVTSCNDGALFRWRKNIKRTDSFYFKDMNYSLADIFKSPIQSQQKTFDDYNLVEKFTGGAIFQTFLDPFNFHRWWSAVEGTLLFDPIVINEIVTYYSKLEIPDYDGTTTNSAPYLLHVNARGIFVIKTEEFGYVCMIPIGMCEVSTVKFNHNLGAGDRIEKGDEIGYFQFGGSSFAIIFEDLSKYGKKIIFQFENGTNMSSNPPLPNPNGDAQGEVIIGVGSQIAKIL